MKDIAVNHQYEPRTKYLMMENTTDPNAKIAKLIRYPTRLDNHPKKKPEKTVPMETEPSRKYCADAIPIQGSMLGKLSLCMPGIHIEGTLGVIQEKLIPSANAAYRSAYAAFSGEDVLMPSWLSESERMVWLCCVVCDCSVKSIGGRIAETRLPPSS